MIDKIAINQATQWPILGKMDGHTRKVDGHKRLRRNSKFGGNGNFWNWTTTKMGHIQNYPLQKRPFILKIQKWPSLLNSDGLRWPIWPSIVTVTERSLWTFYYHYHKQGEESLTIPSCIWILPFWISTSRFGLTLNKWSNLLIELECCMIDLSWRLT